MIFKANTWFTHQFAKLRYEAQWHIYGMYEDLKHVSKDSRQANFLSEESIQSTFAGSKGFALVLIHNFRYEKMR